MALGIHNDDGLLKFSSDTRGDMDSKYDVKRFVFFSESTVLRRATSLRVFVVEDGDNNNREISIPIILAGSRLQGPARVLLVAIGAAGPAMVGALAIGKLTLGIAAVMIMLGLFAGIGAILPNLRKP